MLPSSTVENYLKAIYLATSGRPEERLLAMGRLASALGVTPGTATTMVKTLAESGLVEYEPYAGVRLTRAGERLAALVLRRHRLIELFLVQVMGLRWDEVHEDAEQLEHVVSERLVDRMDEMLGRPEVDPHGDPIPDAEGIVKTQEAQTLLTCPIRTVVKVTRVLDQDKAFLRFIERHDLKPGQSIEVESRDDAADSVCLRGKNDTRVTIGTGAASKLLVQIAMAVLAILWSSTVFAQGSARPFEITDNSFFVEEAFNQEAGIFQNIATFQMNARDEWDASFTQEWPLFSQTHQISYTIPYAAATGGAGVADAMIHYRVQLMTDGDGTPAFSPRISLIVPSGNADRGLGSGGAGWQVNLPFSEQAGDTYLHWNVGATRLNGVLTPHAAASAIWRAQPMLNLMLETMIQRKNGFTISPGARFGWNRGDAQVVVGVAAPVVWSDGSAVLAGFGYLSYELPFNP